MLNIYDRHYKEKFNTALRWGGHTQVDLARWLGTTVGKVHAVLDPYSFELRAIVNEELDKLMTEAYRNEGNEELIKRQLEFCRMTHEEFARHMGISLKRLQTVIYPPCEFRREINRALEELDEARRAARKLEKTEPKKRMWRLSNGMKP